MADNYEINAKITANTSGFTSGIEGANKSLSGLGESISKVTSKINSGAKKWGLDLDQFYNKGSSIFKDFGIDIDKFAANFGVNGKLVAAIAAVTTALNKFGTEIQKSNAEIVRGTGATGEALRELKKNVTDSLVSGVGRSAQEVGSMVADLNTRFGATGEELTSLVQQFDKFAIVTGTDSSVAVNSVADVMKKWNIETKDSNKLLDQLLTASQMSGVSVTTLTSDLKTSQAIFSQFGMSLTESIGLLSSMGKNGVESSLAINAMRTALAKFSSEGKNASKEFKNVAAAIKNAETQTEALRIATEVFGTRGGAEMVKVLRNSSVSADEFTESLRNAGGALRETDEASRTTKDAIDDLKAVFTGTFGGFGEGVANLFKNLIDSLTEVVKFISPIIEPIGDVFNEVFTFIGEVFKMFIKNIVALVNKLNPVFKSMVTMLNYVRNFVHEYLGNILKIFQNTFGMIFAILDGKWVLAWEYAKNSMLRVVDQILKVLSLIVNAFKNMINGIINQINKFIDGYNAVAEFFGWKTKELIKIIEDVDLSESSGLTEKIKQSEEKIAELTGKTAEKITGDLGEIEEANDNYVETVVDGELEIQAAKKQTTDEGKKQIRIATADTTDMLKKEVRTIERIFNGLKKVFTTIGNGIKSAFNLFSRIIDMSFDESLDSLLVFEDKILTFFTEKLPQLPSFIKSVLESVQVLINNLYEVIDPNQLSDIFSTMFEILISTLPSMLEGLLSAIIPGIGSIVKSILTNLPDLLSEIYDSVLDLIDSLFELLDDFFASDGLERIISKTITFIINVIHSVVNNLPTILRIMMNAMETLITAIIENLPDLIITVIESLPNILESIINYIFLSGDFVTKLIDALIQVVSEIVANMPTIIAGLINAIPDIIMAIFEGIVSSITNISGLFSSLFGGSGSGGSSGWDNFWGGVGDWWNNTTTAVGNAFTSIGQGISDAWSWLGGSLGWWATGVNNAPRGLAVVGEQGPELVDFKGGERVYNAHNTAGIIENAGASASNNFNVTFNNLQDTTAYTMMRELKNYQRQMAIKGVL